MCYNLSSEVSIGNVIRFFFFGYSLVTSVVNFFGC